jgi:glutaminyl-peptide cyclotransferase
MQFAPNLVNKVWNLAEELGYGNYFIKRLGSAITDDHTYINYLTGIPSIDIIHYDPDRRDFGKFHHTHDDNMDIIDKNTLKAVGQVVTEVIYRRL